MHRLHRLEQVYAENPVYFLTFCTDRRRAILAEPKVHDAFLCFCREALEREVFVGRYILMPDHIHLFVKLPPPSDNLSIWVKSLKNSLSKQLRQLEQAAPHWQKGFFDHILRFHESYSAKWRYMVENPVRAGLVGDVDGLALSGRISLIGIPGIARQSHSATVTDRRYMK
jgi:putative transposase